MPTAVAVDHQPGAGSVRAAPRTGPRAADGGRLRARSVRRRDRSCSSGCCAPTCGPTAARSWLITIARAFLADPALLILDEATSSVDTRTELLVQQAMAALRSDRTSFVIAHRLSTIRDADLILVMEDGGIVEQGTHEELLAAGGAHWRLHNAQFVGAPT
jgi:hypothetical protein